MLILEPHNLAPSAPTLSARNLKRDFSNCLLTAQTNFHQNAADKSCCFLSFWISAYDENLNLRHPQLELTTLAAYESHPPPPSSRIIAPPPQHALSCLPVRCNRV